MIWKTAWKEKLCKLCKLLLVALKQNVSKLQTSSSHIDNLCMTWCKLSNTVNVRPWLPMASCHCINRFCKERLDHDHSCLFCLLVLVVQNIFGSWLVPWKVIFLSDLKLRYVELFLTAVSWERIRDHWYGNLFLPEKKLANKAINIHIFLNIIWSPSCYRHFTYSLMDQNLCCMCVISPDVHIPMSLIPPVF